MNDKQQLQAMGEHQAEQHMCMAKQIEDLQARLQECANGAAKMQEQRDAAYVMAGKSWLERDKFAQQLKAANQRIAAMAELLRGVSPFLDYVQSGDCHISNDDVSEAIELSDRIAVALAGELPDHIADANKMVPEGWQLVPVVATKSMWAAWDSAPCNNEDDAVNLEAAYSAMLAAAPKPEPTK